MTADRFRFSTLAHAGRAVLGPLSSASVEALLAHIAPVPPAGEPVAVLDVGCGKGELLVRAVTRFGGRGLGVDPNPAFLADARNRAAAAGLAGAIEWREAAFEEAGVTRHAHDVVICTGATHAFGDLPDALAAIASLLRGNGGALVGHGYWKRPPAPDYLATFGGREDEMDPLEATLEGVALAGWSLVAHHASTRHEWDDYELGYAATVRAWLDRHPDDPEAAVFRERLERWAAGYARWGCETMGFVSMVLQRLEPRGA